MNRSVQSNIRYHSTAKLVTKGVVGLILGALLISVLVSTLHIVADNADSASKTDLINWCEDDYYNRDYASLYETLTLYDLYEEEFAVYWEAVNGYQAYVQYRQWIQAEAKWVNEAAEQAMQTLETLEKLAQEPTFAQNRNLLTELYQAALALGE